MMNLEFTYETYQLATNLRNALEKEELLLHYQPRIDLDLGKINGVEAFICWKHPEMGLISPLELISYAEKTGLIWPIGEWVLRTACEQIKKWQKSGLPSMTMSVNLSVRQFFQPNLVKMVQSILEETALSPEYLEIEMNENMVIDDSILLPILMDLKHIGVQVSLNNFGTGNSSLFSLKALPIDKIKIDQCFVRNCTVDAKDASIVKAIVAMSHQLNLEVIADGIKSKDHLMFLQQNRCNMGNGDFFSEPLPADEFVQKFHEIEQIVNQKRIPRELSRQKWLEEALENSRQELSNTVRQQQGMIFKFIKNDGRFIHTLCDGELLYRMNPIPKQVIGKELKDFISANDAEKILPYYRRAWEGEEKVTFEAEHNGIWYFASLRPIRKRGQVVEVIGSCVDITERKESEERYQKVVEFSPKGIVIHREGIILYANPSALKIVKESDLVGKSIYKYLHPSYHEVVQKWGSQAKVGKKLPMFEIKLTRHDEKVIDTQFGSVVIPFGGTSAILTIFSDITDRKRAEEALHQSEEKYRFIAENTQDLIGVLDKNGIVQYASPSHETVLGFPPSMYEGNSAFNLIHPDDLPHIQKQYAAMGSSPCSVVFRYKHAERGWVLIEAIRTPVLDDQGEIKHFVVVARDISNRKKAEEFIRKSEKLAVVGQLAAGVAHEIRNPLTSIKGFVQLLKKELDRPFYTDIILSEVDKLEDIANRFLSLTKPQTPKLDIMNVKTLLEKVVPLFESQAVLQNIEIVQKYDFDLPPIYCDGDQIKQVCMNILQNSMEAMPNGGMVNIEIIQYNPDSIKLRFMDQGTGIPEERLTKIGEPFFSNKEKGTGLGLMISKKIIQEHGGTFHIESKINKGTTVEVVLPIAHEH